MSELTGDTAAGRGEIAAREPLPLPVPRRQLRIPIAHRVPSAWRDLALDTLMLAAAGLASALTAPTAGPPGESALWLVAFSLAVLGLLAYYGAYRPRFGFRFLDDLRSVVAATAVAAMGLTFLRVLFTDDPHAASEAVREWLFAVVYLAAGRGGIQLVEARLRRGGMLAERTLIVGAGRVGQLIANRLLARPEFGLRPVAFLDDDPLEVEQPSGIPVLGLSADRDGSRSLGARVDQVVRQLDVQNVIITFSTASHQSDLEVVRRCERLGASVWLVPRLFEGVTDQTRLERLGGLPLVSVHPTDPRGWQFAVKYAFDRAFAALAILLTAPVLVGVAAAVLGSLGRPVLFRQRRLGLDGREFDMLKFRTMRSVEEEESVEAAIDAAIESGLGPGGIEGADRRTRLGRFLRRTSLDELPQLLNVLRGEMSLIGPRPERVSFAREFDQAVYRYADRHRVKSGVTGWAQVHGLRGNTSLADRVEWDNYYIENWSLWLDLKILALTPRAILHHRDR